MDRPNSTEFITDGFQNWWYRVCPFCGADMQIVRPGKCRCSKECHISYAITIKESEDDDEEYYGEGTA